MSSGSSKKAVLTALGANVTIALAKSVGAFFTKSGTLFAESLHSWADCTNQILLLIGMSQSQKKPDEDHPMGYGKVGYFYSMCVAMLLFFIAGVASATQGLVNKLQQVKIDSSPEGSFCAWLKGFLDATESLEVNDKQFSKISTKLYELNTKNQNTLSSEKPNLFPQNNNEVQLRC